jgi:hypothetical protein
VTVQADGLDSHGSPVCESLLSPLWRVAIRTPLAPPSHQLIQDRKQHHPTIIHDRPAHEDRRSGRRTGYSIPTGRPGGAGFRGRFPPSSPFYKPVAMSSHRCRNFPVLPRLIYGSCMTWCTRQVIPGDDDHPPVVWHSVDVTGSAFGQPQTRSAGATSTDFLG